MQEKINSQSKISEHHALRQKIIPQLYQIMGWSYHLI